MNIVKYEDLKVGMSDSITKTISEADIYGYAGITGDFNPAHINSEYAKGTMFETRIAHGMLSAGLISAVVGTRLPGPGSIYVGQTLKFVKPVRIGDTITATATITELIPEKQRVVLETVCTNQNGDTVIAGEAKMMIPR